MYELFCGDCLKVMDDLITDGRRVNSVICDIPYGTTACSWDTVIPFNHMWDRLHPTQKPLLLMVYLVRTFSNEGDVVLDFTMGVGTTGVACLAANRRFIGIELEQSFFRQASARMQSAAQNSIKNSIIKEE